MSNVVVDASIATKWLFAESDSPAAILLCLQWVRQGLQPTAPSWFFCEVANVTMRRVRAQAVSLADAQQGVREMARFVAVRHVDPSLSARAIELAIQFGQGAVYDAHYLALAEQLSCEFWTADERLWQATHPTLAWVKWLGQVTSQIPPASTGTNPR
jgi:predicted nucleic acid-binding protein